MNLNNVREAYQYYCFENKTRKKLIEAILRNDHNGIIDNQRKYIKIVNLTNDSLTKVLNTLSYEEIYDYYKQTLVNPKYHDLNHFFMLLLSYNQLLFANNNGNKFSEHKESLYFNLVKWYVNNHGINSNDRDSLINEVIETTSSSVSVRNILSNREEVNDTFEKVNIRNELEGKLLFNMFLKEINLFVILMNGALIKQCITMGNSIPKSLVLRLVLLNLITKEYSLGFSIEEYIEGYFERHDIMGEILNFPSFTAGNSMLKLYVDDLLLEVNDITNEFLNQKKK